MADTGASVLKRALVTGGAGLVGSNLVDDLLEAGFDVVCRDDLSAGVASNLDTAREYGSRFVEVVGDISDTATVDRAMDGIDVVFHEAVSKNTVCMRDPHRDLEVNAGGTLELLLAAVRHGVKKFVHASTGSVYGQATVFPTPEDAPLAPVSYYGVSKLAAERYVHAIHSLHGLATTILRYFHVFGPRQDSSDVGGVVPIFIRRALAGQRVDVYGDGTQLRAFTFVKDVTAINIVAARSPQSTGQVYNCASDNRVTIAQLAETVLQLLGRNASEIDFHAWRAGDIKYFDISNARLKEHLGYDFGYTFEEGLDLTIASMRNAKH